VRMIKAENGTVLVESTNCLVFILK